MSNKNAKQRLIEIYGAECFIDKLGLRKFDKPTRYTSKGQRERMKQLTYHHIKMKKDGGKATVENGALLSADNHEWFHRQSKEKQRQMNKAFQEYKRCSLAFTDIPEADFEIDFVEIEVTDHIKVKKFDRAKVKKETKELIKEYEEIER